MGVALTIIIAILACYAWYLWGYRNASLKMKEVGERWAKEVAGEQTDYLEQWIRLQVSGLRLAVRQEEVDLHDDIDDEIKSMLAAEDNVEHYKWQMNLAINEPTALKKLMQKGLDNVNKRYGIKKH